MFPQAISEDGADWAFVLTSLVSVLLSTAILYLIDRPEVHVAFTA